MHGSVCVLRPLSFDYQEVGVRYPSNQVFGRIQKDKLQGPLPNHQCRCRDRPGQLRGIPGCGDVRELEVFRPYALPDVFAVDLIRILTGAEGHGADRLSGD